MFAIGSRFKRNSHSLYYSAEHLVIVDAMSHPYDVHHFEDPGQKMLSRPPVRFRNRLSIEPLQQLLRS